MPLLRSATGLRALVVLAVVIAAVTGCGAPSDQAQATERARQSAEAAVTHLERLLETHRGASGAEWLVLIAAEFPDQPSSTWTEPPLLDEAGRVSFEAAFDGSAESGGGLDYSKVIARVCLRFTWRPAGSRPDVVDTGCTPLQRNPVGPTSGADVFVRFDPTDDR